MQLDTNTRNAILSAVSTAVGADGTLLIATGTKPGITNADSGTPLVTLTAVTFGTPANGVMAVSATAATAGNTGTPGYYRIKTSGGTAKIEGPVDGSEFTCGAITGNGTVTLAASSITAGNAT